MGEEEVEEEEKNADTRQQTASIIHHASYIIQ
jgi:hypothetical protein